MAGLNIPGVTDTYNTNDTIEKLMKVERIPLTREQNQLETLKAEKDAWREINSRLSTLRDSTKSLYSFENPFSNKLTTSSEENAITAEASRTADIQSFKIDVLQPASSDRLLTDELEKDYKVEKGIYTFKVGEKKVSVNWKGGSLKDFSDALNKRSNGTIKTMLIGASQGKKSFLIEAVETGKENKLIFEDDAKTWAEKSGILGKANDDFVEFGKSFRDLKETTYFELNKNELMPDIKFSNTSFKDNVITLNPRGAFELDVPSKVSTIENSHISFKITANDVEDITTEINNSLLYPEIPESGEISFGGITIFNSDSESTFEVPENQPDPLNPIIDENILSVRMSDGTEKNISIPDLLSGKEVTVNFNAANVESIILKNTNTSKQFTISDFSASNPDSQDGLVPKHAISKADDAIIKYEGITVTRPSNKIDDIIPEITLNIKDKTEKTATLAVKPDVDSSKEALITFVGKYNQAVAELNILSQTKPELIEELDYLTDDEKEKERERLGLFQTDFSLSSIKSNMSTIVNSGYATSDAAQITMLSQIGISTNASGFSNSYSQGKLRGYLEIDEKKLDSALENNLNDIKSMFGFDSDGDLIIDSGIAYQLDKQLTAYTQTGGILAMKTSSLDSKIKSSEQKIARLETQMDDKEAELRKKFSTMQGSLNSLESQQNSISNFSKQNSNNN